MTAEDPPPNATRGPGPAAPYAGPPAADERIQLDVSHPRGNAVLLTISGEIDAATIQRVEDALWPNLSAAVYLIVVDLSGVGFLGVTGLHLLTRAHMRSRARGIALRIVATDHEIWRALQVAGLHVVLDCHQTVSAALHDDGPGGVA